MRIVAESPEVPSNGFAVRKDLNSATKTWLKALLLTMDESQEGREVLKKFGALRFVRTSDEDYEAIHNMIKDLGIDLDE